MAPTLQVQVVFPMATLSRKRRREARIDADQAATADRDAVPSVKRGFTNGRCVSVSDQYEKVGRLGEGTYGIVYQARDKRTSRDYALKRCIPHHEQSDGFPITTLREIQTLRMCRNHVNIVQLHEVAVSKSGVFLVLEYCEHDLAKLIDRHYQQRQRSPFAEAERKSLTQQLLRGLQFLHSRHLLHRDLKMSNLLYHRGCLKIADFGLSRPHAPSMTPQVASLWYRAPEILFGGKHPYSYPMDVWAAGCIMAEFIQGFPLFQGVSEMNQIDLVMESLGRPTSEEWSVVGSSDQKRPFDGPHGPSKFLDSFQVSSSNTVDLLLSMLRYDPHQRATAAAALAMPYFSEKPLPTEVTDMPHYR